MAEQIYELKSKAAQDTLIVGINDLKRTIEKSTPDGETYNISFKKDSPIGESDGLVLSVRQCDSTHLLSKSVTAHDLNSDNSYLCPLSEKDEPEAVTFLLEHIEKLFGEMMIRKNEEHQKQARIQEIFDSLE